MSEPFQLRIEEIFFPVQELSTNPEHVIKEDKSGTQIKNNFNIGSNENAPDRIFADLSVEINRETSVNPPYIFRLHTRVIVKIEGKFEGEFDEKRVTRMVFDIAVGAARERMLELSSRNSFGRFMLPMIVMSGAS